MLKDIPNIDRYQEEQKLLNNLRNSLRKILKWYQQSNYCQPLIERAIDALTVTTFDAGVLSLGKARKKFRTTSLPLKYVKHYCLLVTIYGIVELWWGYRQKRASANSIQAWINYLNHILASGLDKVDVIGNIKFGWRLK